MLFHPSAPFSSAKKLVFHCITTRSVRIGSKLKIKENARKIEQLNKITRFHQSRLKISGKFSLILQILAFQLVAYRAEMH